MGLGFSFYAEDKASPKIAQIADSLSNLEKAALSAQGALKFRFSGETAIFQLRELRETVTGITAAARAAQKSLKFKVEVDESSKRGLSGLGGGKGMLGGLGGLFRRTVGFGLERTVGRGLFSDISGGAFGKLAGALPKGAEEFEAKMANLGAISGLEKGSKAFNELQESAINAGIKTQFTSAQAADALTKIMQTGKSSKEAMEMLLPTLDLAAASFGKLSTGKAAETIGAIMNQFKHDKSVEGAGMVADKLVKMAQISSFQVAELKNYMVTAGTVATQFKMSLNDTLILGAASRGMGAVPSKSGTQVQDMLTRMYGGGKSTKELKALIGGDLFDATGNMKKDSNGMTMAAEGLIKLGEAVQKMPDEKRLEKLTKILGKQGGRAFNAFINSSRQFETKDASGKGTGEFVTLSGIDLLKRQREELNQSTGAAQKFRETLLDTWKGAKEVFESSLEAFRILIGLPAAEAAGSALRKFNDAINELIEFVKTLPKETIKTLGTLFMMAAGFLTFVGGVHMGIIALKFIIPLIIKMAVSFMIFLVLLPVIAALGAAVWGLYVLINNAFTGAGGSIKDFFGRVYVFFHALFQLFKDGKLSGKEMLEALVDPKNAGVLEWVVAVYQAFMRFYHFLAGFANGFAFALKMDPSIGAAWDKLKEAFWGLVTVIGRLFGFDMKGFRDFVNAPIGDSLTTGMTAGAKAALMLRDAMLWLTKKIDWMTSAEGLAFFKEVWEGIKTVVFVVAAIVWGMVKVIMLLGKALMWVLEKLGLVDSGGKGFDSLARAATVAAVAIGVVLAAQIGVAVLGVMTMVATLGAVGGAVGMIGLAIGMVSAGVFGLLAGAAIGMIGLKAIASIGKEDRKVDAGTGKYTPWDYAMDIYADNPESSKNLDRHREFMVNKKAGTHIEVAQEDVGRLVAGQLSGKSTSDAGFGLITQAQSQMQASAGDWAGDPTFAATQQLLTKALASAKGITIHNDIYMDGKLVAVAVRAHNAEDKQLSGEGNPLLAGGGMQ